MWSPCSLSIAGLEMKLGVQLPAKYQGILQTYPSRLLPSDDSSDSPANWELLAKPRHVLKLNRRERRRWRRADYGKQPFPASYVLIGHDGGGNLFAIDAASNDQACPVLEFDHEIPEWRRCADSLEEYMSQLAKMYKE